MTQDQIYQKTVRAIEKRLHIANRTSMEFQPDPTFTFIAYNNACDEIYNILMRNYKVQRHECDAFLKSREDLAWVVEKINFCNRVASKAMDDVVDLSND